MQPEMLAHIKAIAGDDQIDLDQWLDALRLDKTKRLHVMRLLENHGLDVQDPPWVIQEASADGIDRYL